MTKLTPETVDWDKIRHAPLCDDRTNEILCIYLELTRIVASLPTPIIYKETLEDFSDYAIRRLNILFGTGFQLRRSKPRPVNKSSSNDIDLPLSSDTVVG